MANYTRKQLTNLTVMAKLYIRYCIVYTISKPGQKAEQIIGRLPSLIELTIDESVPSALPDFVYAALKRRILTCVFPPGHQLGEKQLSDELNVSRTPVREALNRLANEGLVSLRRHRGFVVAPITLQDIRELCEIRRALETESAALAAERATTSEIEHLESLAELHYEPGKRVTYENYLRANSAFHLALARCSHNVRLESMVMGVLDQLQRPMYLGLDFGLDCHQATSEHFDIVAFIKARDAIGARAVMGRNFDHTEKQILAALRTAGYDPSPK